MSRAGLVLSCITFFLDKISGPITFEVMKQPRTPVHNLPQDLPCYCHAKMLQLLFVQHVTSLPSAILTATHPHGVTLHLSLIIKITHASIAST